MNAKLFTASETSRVAPNMKLASLPSDVQLAIAICSSIGVGATAGRAKEAATSLVMRMAYNVQTDALESFEELDDQIAYRDAQWRERMQGVIAALHDAATQRHVADLRLHQHVGVVRQKGSEPLTGLQSLLAKASNAVESYDDMIRRGWDHGVVIAADDVQGVGKVPESYSKFKKRTAEAIKAATIVTEGSKTASLIDKVGADIRVALLGTDKAPREPDAGLCATLQGLFNSLNYLVLSANGGNEIAIAAIADLADAAAGFAQDVTDNTATDSQEQSEDGEGTKADELPEGSEGPEGEENTEDQRAAA